MKAVVLKEFGGPENLSLGDLPIPSVEPGTVLIWWTLPKSVATTDGNYFRLLASQCRLFIDQPVLSYATRRRNSAANGPNCDLTR